VGSNNTAPMRGVLD